MSNNPQPISIISALGALSRLNKLTHHHILMQSMITEFLSKEEERKTILEDAILYPGFDEAHVHLAVMQQQLEDAGTMLLRMSLEIGRMITAEESVLSGFPSMEEEVKRLKRARRDQLI